MSVLSASIRGVHLPLQLVRRFRRFRRFCDLHHHVSSAFLSLWMDRLCVHPSLSHHHAQLYNAHPLCQTDIHPGAAPLRSAGYSYCYYLTLKLHDAQFGVSIGALLHSLPLVEMQPQHFSPRCSLNSAAQLYSVLSPRVTAAVASEASPSPLSDMAPPLHASLADAPSCAAQSITQHHTTSDASSLPSPLPPPCDCQPTVRRALRLVGGGDTLQQQCS